MSSASLSRRAFLTGRRQPTVERILPPGASLAGLDACTGCGDCAAACPTGIIRLADGRPSLDFASGECLFCNACAEACAEPVFSAPAPARFTHAVAISGACLAARGVACMSCRDACPQDAIRFRPRVGGPFLPELAEAACTGCGACIAPCPAGAIAVAARQTELIHA